MVRIRKIAAIAVLCVVAAGYGTVSPAQAETLKTETLEGLARSAGLDLKLGSSSLTLGFAESKIDATLANASKTLSAVGKGAGQLLSASEVLTKAPTLSGLLTDSKTQECVANLPLAGILNVSLACGISAATVLNDLPGANAAGHVADIRIPGTGPLGALLNSLGTSLADLTGTLDGILGATSAPAAASAADSGLLGGLLGDLGAVNSLVPGLTSGGITGALDTLLDTLTGGASLSSLVPDPVVITVGSSTSKIKTEVSKVTSTATSSGVEIKLLPVAAVPLLANGLIRVVIGEASTVATLNRLTGESTAEYTAANLLHLQVLGVDVPVSPNLDLNLPGILRLVLGKGTTQDLSNGSLATATGASLNVLNGLLELTLAKAESSVGGSLKLTEVLPQVVNRVEQPRELPRTGVNGPLFAVLGGGVLVLAVFTRRAVLRTR